MLVFLEDIIEGIVERVHVVKFREFLLMNVVRRGAPLLQHPRENLVRQLGLCIDKRFTLERPDLFAVL